MYIVRNSHSVIVAITTDKKDAEAIASGRGIDPRSYHRHPRHPIFGGPAYLLEVLFNVWGCPV